MAVNSESLKQLALLRIFAEHSNQLLYKMAPQIAEIFGISQNQAQDVFDLPEFSTLMQMLRKEWLISVREVPRNYDLQFSRTMAHDTWVNVEIRGSESLEAGRLLPSTISNRRSQPNKPSTTTDTISDLVNDKAKSPPNFTSQRQAIEKIAASIAVRRGQKAFRDKLFAAYGNTCLMTGPNIEAILEAAHIQPYATGGPFDVTNGLLLRADIHTLFDLHLLAVDSTTMTILVSAELDGTLYANLSGEALKFPDGSQARPSPLFLDEHRQAAGLG